MAGYSRGAFYSNFDSKEQVFLAVIDQRRPKALDNILQRVSEPVERIAAVRNWFANQWRLKDFIALRMEFSRRAFRDRSVRTHLAELLRQDLEIYSASLGRFLCAKDEVAAERPEIIGLVLLAVAQGLGTIAHDTGPEWEHMYTEAARLAFDRIAAPQIFQRGQLQC
jgi:AcrR family transcriptional regulator